MTKQSTGPYYFTVRLVITLFRIFDPMTSYFKARIFRKLPVGHLVNEGVIPVNY